VCKILKDAASDFHDLDNLGDPDKDVAISCSSRFIARLYDQKKSFASSHHNINKLRVNLATGRDASLVRLPPLTCFLQSRLDAKNPRQFAIRIPLVKAEVVLPDRKHAKLWSGMRHEEYTDEAPLLKVVI
jgi:hypothetical protein